jgi:hypothetical protein
MGSNVTRGAMKNLVTDTPSPITVALVQTGDNLDDFYVQKASK